MTTVFPLRNLGPDAEPWGRTVQGAVSGLERDLAQAINSNNATDQMQTTQLNSLVQKQQALSAQQELLQSQQDRILSSTVITPRTSTFTKSSGGAPSGQIAEYSGEFTKPSWASFAVVSQISSGVSATFTPDPSPMDDPEMSAHMFASNAPIADSINFDTWRVVWYVSPFDENGTYQNFAVSVPGDTLYIKQRVLYNAILTASVAAEQAIVINWV